METFLSAISDIFSASLSIRAILEGKSLNLEKLDDVMEILCIEIQVASSSSSSRSGKMH